MRLFDITQNGEKRHAPPARARELETTRLRCDIPSVIHAANRNRNAAMTLVELLVVIVVVGVLSALLAVSLTSSRERRARLRCVENLKQMGLAFRTFATDHGDLFPMQGWTNRDGSLLVPENGAAACFLTMTNDLSSPKVLVCPADTRNPARRFAGLKNENISYFLGLDADETRPQMLLAGDRNLSLNSKPVKSGLLAVTTNDVLGLTAELHGFAANVVLADGSVQQFSPGRLRTELLQSGAATNRFLVP